MQVREIAQVFSARAELMTPGENTDEHLTAKQEEASIVERDKANADARTGGLFRGCFKALERTNGHEIIRDTEDGVDRCPMCAWELENGFCNSCNMTYGSGADDIDDYSGESADLDQSDTDSTVSDDFIHQSIANRDVLETEHPDDISLDGDGLGLHTSHYNSDFNIGRAAARGLIGRPMRRFASPVTSLVTTLQRRGYAASMLSDVTTTHDEEINFSDIEEEEDDGDENDMGGFVVNDVANEGHTTDGASSQGSPRSSLGFDVNEEHWNDDDGILTQNQEANTYWIDDSAVSSGHTSDSDDANSINDIIPSPSGSSDASDEEAAPQPPRTRKRRRIVADVSSSEESTWETGSERLHPRKKLSRSGSVTVRRQSPELGTTRSIAERPNCESRSRKPIVITSSDNDSEADQPPRPANRRRLPRHTDTNSGGVHPRFAHHPRRRISIPQVESFGISGASNGYENSRIFGYPVIQEHSRHWQRRPGPVTF